MDAAQEKIAIARLSVYSNTGLVALKLVVGFFMGSVAVVSEALHSGVDLIAAVIARFSVKKSAEPADKDHRFGHGKYENLSGFVEGALIFVAAAWIIYQAVLKFMAKTFQIDLVAAGIVVMGISAVVNFYVARRLMEVAKRTDSLALEADAYHLQTDVWTSVGVFLALVLIQFTDIHLLDPGIAMVVAAFIIRAAYDITRKSAEGLLDRSLPEEEIRLIERIMKDHESDFVNFHKLRARKAGSERQIDLHLTVPQHLNIKEGHDLAEHLAHEIRKEFPQSVVVIHVEPCDQKCDVCRMNPPENALAGIKR